MKLKIEQIGDEVGFVCPDELVSRLNLDHGATFLDAELVRGGLQLLRCGPASDRAMPSGDSSKDK